MGRRGESDNSPEGLAKVAIGGLAVLQGAFTALGALNGSLGAVALNESWLFIAGLIVITAGFLLTLFGMLNHKAANLGLLLGLGLVGIGVAGTAYAALAVPTKSSSPTVDVEVVSTRPMLLRAKVKATGIKREELFQIVAEGYDESGGEYRYVPPVLYHAVLGANSSGEVSSRFEIAIPPGKYDAVGVDAWSGSSPPPGACGFSVENPGRVGFRPSEISRLGCAVVRVAGVNARRG